MHKLHEQYAVKETAQSQPIPGREEDMVENNAGGYGFVLGPWKRLDRFLILGSEGGTYYVGEKDLTVQNAQNLHDLINEDGERVVNRIVEISTGGRAYKQDPALFALALASSVGDEGTRRVANSVLSQVARTGSHLFQYLQYRQSMAGWGRSIRGALSNWYNTKEPRSLTYQVLKYRQRYGWTHRDVLRVAHPTPTTTQHNEIFSYVTQGDIPVPDADYSSLINVFEEIQHMGVDDANDVVDMIQKHRLTREMIPDEFLQSDKVWEALLAEMPLHAMVRNLGNLTRRGIISAGSEWAKKVEDDLTDVERLRRSRMHPMALLVALKMYTSGGSGGRAGAYRTDAGWSPVSRVSDALDKAFYLSFGNVESTGKKIMLALDVSGSMEWAAAGTPWLTAREASAAMALITRATEPESFVMAFSHKFVPIDISPRMRLDDVIQKVSGLDFGATDCSLPMQYARGYTVSGSNNYWGGGRRSYTKGTKPVSDVDAFVVYTDSETWFGDIHPSQALDAYRKEHNPEARLAVVAMSSSHANIVDEKDAGQLQVVGFDTATPNLLSEFVVGRL